MLAVSSRFKLKFIYPFSFRKTKNIELKLYLHCALTIFLKPPETSESERKTRAYNYKSLIANSQSHFLNVYHLPRTFLIDAKNRDADNLCDAIRDSDWIKLFFLNMRELYEYQT